jgi:transposase-like protein
MANAGRRGRPIALLVLTAEERAYLERQVRRHRLARSLSERCRVVLRCADGLSSKSVAAELGHHEHTVGKWRRRFLKDRCEGLLDEARPGRPRTIDDDQVAAVIERGEKAVERLSLSSDDRAGGRLAINDVTLATCGQSRDYHFSTPTRRLRPRAAGVRSPFSPRYVRIASMRPV